MNCAQVAEHYDNVADEGVAGRKRSPIINLRNFNNWIKSTLITNTWHALAAKKIRHLYVLDIGAGKGGDLTKWMKLPVKYMMMTDISSGALELAKERARKLRIKFPIDFLYADITSDIISVDRIFNVVSCQFMLHYSFESLDQVKCLLHNMVSHLRRGGYVIGTTLNANEIILRLRQSSGLSFGNDIYKITFDSKDSFPLFGCRYNFYLEGVVNCPEFLVNIDVLNILAQEQGLELVSMSTFSDFYDRYKKQPFKLSKEEWEVLTLYVVIIYRKM